MVVREEYWQAAQIASDICGVPAEWIYSQWYHETAGWNSELCKDYNNLGGLTQEEENDLPQPDGSYYYMKFQSIESYARYFGKYIKKWFPHAAQATSMQDYAYQLKYGEEYVYYGASLEEYTSGMEHAYSLAFDSP